MKQKIAVLTDSSSSVYAYDHGFDNIFVIDIHAFIGDQIFTDFKNTGDGPFLEALAKADVIAKTSQPSIGETLAMYDHIKDLGFTNIIYLPIAKELSGTYQNAHLAKNNHDGIEIEIVDTQTTVSILGKMVLIAAQMAKEGHSVPEIVEVILSLKTKWGFFFGVNDLSSLVKNGRLSNAKSFIANMLKIKPLLEFSQDGHLFAKKNIRTFNKTLLAVVDAVVEKVASDKTEIHVLYTNNTDDLNKTIALIKEKLPNNEIKTFTLSPTIVAHVGLAVIGVGWINL